ncbi:uncharacterized protein LOC110100606 [Dendrobium catenatum]|uniref:DUF1639 domain-containing protein n=1 Tax=Dendrobium catenatum TaxID=906689 RepID=A0A2I0VCE4_9ASPA|nr:uncharacterized protein LOC110100606 [Dendrobium catenatum]PKU61079.1 hypothetical protein MA16_Dca020452 [Dendrobium catenatum]
MVSKEGEAGWRGTELSGASCDKSVPSLPARRVLKYPLHNFSFPTRSWGCHRVFRCVNSVAETGLSSTALMDMETRRDNHGGKLQNSSPPEGGSSEKEASASAVATVATTATMPWNLRKRRAACFSPGENGRNRCPSISPSHCQFGRGNPGKADQMLEGGDQVQRRKFSISLSREEIERDLYVLKGTKPSRRPQKRPRIVQRKLDELFPGLWLEEVTLDSYKVDE